MGGGPRWRLDERMTTDTLILSAFLLARIEEDREMRRVVSDNFEFLGDRLVDMGTHIEAQARALRAIVELHDSDGIGWCPTCDNSTPTCDTLRALASVYIDHPDYRAEWAL